MPYIKTPRATKLLGNKNDQQTYRQVREKLIPPGVVFWVGKSLRFDEEALKAWAARGGTSLNQQEKTDSAAHAQADSKTAITGAFPRQKSRSSQSPFINPQTTKPGTRQR